MNGWTPDDDQSVDRKIYDHFVNHGKKDPDIVEALAERLHDHAIDDGLTDLLEGRVEQDGVKKVVAIMGGHSTGRDDPSFRKVAHLARALTEAGYFIASGDRCIAHETATAWDRNPGDLKQSPAFLNA